jgi:hypothetical protein
VDLFECYVTVQTQRNHPLDTFAKVNQNPMQRFYIGTACSVGVLLLFCSIGRADDKLPMQGGVHLFFKQHCFKCHSEQKVEGDLRLDKLALPASSVEADSHWMRIAEVVSNGEMPPPEEKRPEPAAAKFVVDSIATALAKSKAPRPLSLRRLNRVEYENTVRELLGINTDLAEMLPEDGSIQGFDKVGDGLSISTILMERYLEAANTAYEAVFRRITPSPLETKHLELLENKENMKSVTEKRAGTIEVEGSLIKFNVGWPPVRLDETIPRENGTYKTRIAMWPYQPGDRSLTVALYIGPQFGPGKTQFVGMYDVTGTSDQPRIIEFERYYPANHTVHVVPWIYPGHKFGSTDPRPGIAIKWAETEGPLEQEWPAKAQVKLFGPNQILIDGPNVYNPKRKGLKKQLVDSKTPREDIERIIRDFVPRAFRRPVKDEVVQKYIHLALSRLDAGRSFEDSVRAGITSILCSPQFLLLNYEPLVDDYTLASRMSYFLWSTMPDDELMKLADAGKLRDPQVRRAQVLRMLNDPKSEQFVSNFAGQWLDLREIEFTTPDKKQFFDWDDMLQESMLGETHGFFRHLLKNDLSVMNFVNSDFTLLNERLAKFYGIPGVKGNDQFQLVKIPEGNIRGGILTHGSVLKVTANGTNTSPIVRGVWILDKLLGQPPPPPPPGIPAFEPDIRGATSIREQLALHSSNQACSRCHVRIDPPGMAMETFDPIGRKRDNYYVPGNSNKKPAPPKVPVDPHGEMFGKEFKDFREFRQILSEQDQLFAHALAEKLIVYGTGRKMTVLEGPAIDQVVATSRKNDLGFRSMIQAVVESELFIRP